MTSSIRLNDKLSASYIEKMLYFMRKNDKLMRLNDKLRTSFMRLPGLFFIDFGEPYTTIFDHI